LKSIAQSRYKSVLKLYGVKGDGNLAVRDHLNFHPELCRLLINVYEYIGSEVRLSEIGSRSLRLEMRDGNLLSSATIYTASVHADTAASLA